MSGRRSSRKTRAYPSAWRTVARGLAILTVVGCAGTAGAQQTAPSTADLAHALAEKLKAIREQLVGSARLAQENEDVVSRAERRLEDLEIVHATRLEDLDRQRRDLSGLAIGLQRLARQPVEAIITSPQSPLDTARAMMLVRALVPETKARADAIARDIADLGNLRADIAAERERLVSSDQSLELERDRLDALIERKNLLWRSTRGGRSAADANEADMLETVDTLDGLFRALRRFETEQRDAAASLKALLDRGPEVPPAPRVTMNAGDGDNPPPLAQPPRPEPRPSDETVVGAPGAVVGPVPRDALASLKGRLTVPAAGVVVERFARSDSLGFTTKGIALRTRPGARVVATHDGNVIYAGPFRGYGRIIIIEHGDGFHTLLAGLGRIDVRLGQGVLAGEPVGVMGTAATAERQDPRRLYIELRHDGVPVNPLAWLADRKETVNQ